MNHLITTLTPAALGKGVTKVTQPATAAALALSVVQAFEAGTGAGVT